MNPLSPFQIGGLLLLAPLFALSLAVAVRRRRLANWAWVAVWLGGIVLMVYPDLSATMAHALGIQRGADLVIYSYILLSTAALFSSYLRDRQLERTITVLVRNLAIRDAREPDLGLSASFAEADRARRQPETAETGD